jgi:lysophospholipase L1-like esterase
MRHISGLIACLMLVTACSGAAPAASPGTAAPDASRPVATESAAPPTDPSTPPSAETPAANRGAKLPAGPLTIATLGDSLTEGDGDDAGIGYPGRLKTLVDAVRPGTRIINVSHSGWTSGDLVNNEPSQIGVALAGGPNVALVWIGSNDLWGLYEYGPEPSTDQAEQEDLEAYEANLDQIVQELTSHGVGVWIALLDDQSKRPTVTNPPNPAEPAFPATTKADLVRMSAHVLAYNDIIRRVAAQYGASTVDFYSTTIFTDPATLNSDGNHPNGAGYDVIAAKWFAALGLK